MRGRMGVVAVGLSVVLVFGACTPGGAEPSGGGASSATPMASVSAAPSSDAEMDALYAEAEQVFWRSMELRYAYELRGDFAPFPDEMSELLADRYLEAAKAQYDFYVEKQWHSPEGAEPVVAVARYPGAAKSGSEVALVACIDTRPTPALNSDGQIVSEGNVHRWEMFFKHFDGKLKLFDGTSKEMSECWVG